MKFSINPKFFQTLSIAILLAACVNPASSVIDDGFLGGVHFDASQSTVTVSASSVPAGGTSIITVTPRDQNGAVFKPSTSLTITISMVGGTSTGTLSAITNLGNGSFSAIFTGINGGTPATAVAYVNQVAISRNLPTIVVSTSGFSKIWPFDATTPATFYDFDNTRIEFVSGVTRLIASDQVDDANDPQGFASATANGVMWDSTYLRLTQSGSATNTAEFDSSWAPQWASLVSYWKMNNNWNDSKSSNHGTGQNGVTFSTSAKVGTHAGSFDGSDDYVTMGSPTSLNITGPLSISAWVYVNAFNSYDGIVVKGFATSGYSIHIRSDLSLWFEIDNAGTRAAYNPPESVLIPGSWNHVAATYNGSVMRIFVNGREAGTGLSSTVNPAADVTEEVIVGKRPGNGTLNGKLDDLAIWSTALTPTEISNIYLRQAATYSGSLVSRAMNAFASADWTKFSWLTTLPFFKPLPDYASSAVQNETTADYSSLVGSTGATDANDLMVGIKALWHFDEPAGTVGANSIKDRSGNANHGQPNGPMNFAQVDHFHKAPFFAAGGSRAQFAGGFTNTIKGDDIHSISFWFNANGTNTNLSPVVFDAKDGAYFDYFFELNFSSLASGVVNTFYWSVGGTYRTYSGLSLKPNQWHHVVLVKTGSGNLGDLYADGKLVNTYTGTLSSTPNVSSDLWISSFRNSGYEFIGSIDEFGIWNRALHANEIQQLYRRGVNRIKFQMRTCATANAGLTNCTDDTTGANWKGPDGTNQTYFSELNNNTVPLAQTGLVKKNRPSLSLSDFTSPVTTNPFFQYRAILESDDTGTNCNYGSGATWCSPELKSVSVDPIHFDSTSPTVVTQVGENYASLSGFTETLGAGCTGGVTYNLGIGSSYGAATWYWWDSAALAGVGNWVVANGTSTRSNAAAIVNSHISTFHTALGAGTLYIKAFLNSDGLSTCEIDQLGITGQR